MKIKFACNLLSRLRGLIGREEFDGLFVLAPCDDIHTIGMRRPIDVAFVNVDGVVLESYRRVPPNRRLRNRRAALTLERYSIEASWYEPGDVVQLGVQRE